MPPYPFVRSGGAATYCWYSDFIPLFLVGSFLVDHTDLWPSEILFQYICQELSPVDHKRVSQDTNTKHKRSRTFTSSYPIIAAGCDDFHALAACVNGRLLHATLNPTFGGTLAIWKL